MAPGRKCLAVRTSEPSVAPIKKKHLHPKEEQHHTIDTTEQRNFASTTHRVAPGLVLTLHELLKIAGRDDTRSRPGNCLRKCREGGGCA